MQSAIDDFKEKERIARRTIIEKANVKETYAFSEAEREKEVTSHIGHRINN